MPSFDIVSEIDSVELKNAVDNAKRELATRFDFRNVDASFELNKEVVKVAAESDFQVNQMMDILRGNLAKRGVMHVQWNLKTWFTQVKPSSAMSILKMASKLTLLRKSSKKSKMPRSKCRLKSRANRFA